jgi:UDP-2,3-diacylglucosamine pyrophosphatase LpxH
MRVLAFVVRVCTFLVYPALVAVVVLGVLAIFFDADPLLVIVAAAVLAALVVVIFGYTQALKRLDGVYTRGVASRLNEIFDDASILERTIDLDTKHESIIVFSDQHKGTRDPADDFWRAERAYCAALGWYYELRYRLIVLGDAEELWETWDPRKVIEKHTDKGMEHKDQGKALTLEAMFDAADRYDRVWGNHDLTWVSPRKVEKYLGRGGPFGEGFVVREALKIQVRRGGKTLGVLFLVHGHQGTADSEVITRISRPVVWLFGWLQRKFNRGWNTPASSLELRNRHDRAMADWAESRAADGVALIAGHTHRPVFWRSRREVPTDEKIEELEAALAAAQDPGARANARTALELARGERRWEAEGRPPKELAEKAYFNAGCCSFSDGDVTGLEISGGRIRLVRWLDNQGEPRPQRFKGACADLGELFEAIRPPGA